MEVLDLKNYELVKDRIMRFHRKYPDGRIITVIDLVDDGKACLCKAFLFLNVEDQAKNLPKATGLAYEKEGFNTINMKSWIENGETSAIGRAIANMGMVKKNRPSREEMEKAGSTQESKVTQLLLGGNNDQDKQTNKE